MTKTYRDTIEAEIDGSWMPGADAAPGKRSMTQGLAPRPILFRVESAEAARELGAAFGPRNRNGVAEHAEAAVDQAAGGSGAPLRDDVRERFESSLGADLSGVRVHTSGASEQAAEAVGAKAYTVGNDIHFGAGQYQPDDPFGVHLLAHEVAHTVQQAGGAPHRQHKLEVSTPGDAAEVEADRAADAMVAGAPASVSGAGGGLARKEQPKDLDADAKNRLANAKQLVEKADANASKAITSLSNYGNKGSACLEAIKASYDAYIEVYEGQFKMVNVRIESAKAMLKMQQSVIVGALSAVFAPVAAGIVSAELGIASTVEAVQSAYAGLSEWVAPIGGAMVDGTVETSGAQIGGNASLAGGDGDTVNKKLAFWTSFAKLQASSTRLVGLAANAAEINKAIGKVKEAIDGSQNSGKARTDYAPAKIEDDAARLEGGTRSLGAAAPSIDGALAKMQAAKTQMAALKPDAKTIEKEIWINWAGSLPASETGVNGILDADGIESHLKSIGVWSQLGIEIGDYFSDEEEAMAVASASAVSKVLAHKGATVDVEVWGSKPMTNVKIGDLPALPVTISGIPPHPSQEPGADLRRTVKAQVVSASANRTLDPALLKKTDKTKTMVVEMLLDGGYITVQMQALETSAPRPKDTVPWGMEPEPETHLGPPSIHGSYR